MRAMADAYMKWMEARDGNLEAETPEPSEDMVEKEFKVQVIDTFRTQTNFSSF